MAGVVAVANDATVIVAGAAVMTSKLKLLESDHGRAIACSKPCGGAADAAESDDGHVTMLHTGLTVGQTKAVREQDVWVETSDAVRLAITLTLPDGPPPDDGWPALVEALPYRKDDLTSGYRSEYHRLADEGAFVVARVDLRGTGSSTGIATDEYPPEELTDVATVIAWLASQSWSNGNVGMYGTSYSGFNSLQVAATRPPALKAIIPIYASDDRYSDDVHFMGGALRAIDVIDYCSYMTPMNALPPVPAVFGDGWRDEWLKRLEQTPTWMLPWLRNQTNSDYWRAASLRPSYDRIEAATLFVGGWADGYRNTPLRSAAAMTAPVEILLGPWSHAAAESALPGPNLDLIPEMIAWFNRWLRPEANDSTAVGSKAGDSFHAVHRVFMRRATTPSPTLAIHHGEWWAIPHPIESTMRSFDAPWRPTAPINLRVDPATGTTAWISCAGRLPWGQPGDQRIDNALSDCTDWLIVDEFAVLGNPELRLTLSSDQPIANLTAKLCDIHPDGTSQLVTRGTLNLTHRVSSQQPEALIPGQPIEVVVELEATSWIFEPGHTMRLAIGGADWPNTWPTPHPVTLTLWPSTLRLQLPIVVRPALDTPRFSPPSGIEPHGTDGDLAQPPTIWRYEHDVLANTVKAVVDHGSVYRAVHDAHIVEHYFGEVGVPRDDPGSAWARSEISFSIAWPTVTVFTRVTVAMQSTPTHYDIDIELVATEDEVECARRTWRESIPRQWQ